MNTLPKTRKSKQTRTAILKAAESIFAEKGFNKTTVQDIVEKANLAHGTFYLYFKDKKDVFYGLVSQVEDDLFTAANGGTDLSKEYERGYSSYRALRKDLKAIFQSFKVHSHILKFSQELAAIDVDFKKKYNATRERLVKRTEQILKKSGLNKINYHIAAISITGMVESVANELINNEENWDFDDFLPTITKLYFKAVS